MHCYHWKSLNNAPQVQYNLWLMVGLLCTGVVTSLLFFLTGLYMQQQYPSSTTGYWACPSVEFYSCGRGILIVSQGDWKFTPATVHSLEGASGRSHKLGHIFLPLFLCQRCDTSICQKPAEWLLQDSYWDCEQNLAYSGHYSAVPGVPGGPPGGGVSASLWHQVPQISTLAGHLVTVQETAGSVELFLCCGPCCLQPLLTDEEVRKILVSQLGLPTGTERACYSSGSRGMSWQEL